MLSAYFYYEQRRKQEQLVLHPSREELRQLYIKQYADETAKDAVNRNNHEGPPEARPLNSVAQLLTWLPDVDSDDIYCVSSTPLRLPEPADPAAASSSATAASSAARRPKLLVCHDFRNNYLQDRFPQGSDDATAYRLWHWDCVDVFVYFSHHMVTIPPPGWINAAHKHGVQVLGTFITEWSDGSRRCVDMFSDRCTAELAAEQLVAVAKHFGFEGWLINIENHLAPRQVRNMIHFLSYLRARLKQEIRHSVLIWYDAVTVRGRLTWQNTVTDLNLPFMDAADGIFINYTWKDSTPRHTQHFAGGRSADVYMGVDVFGRGTYGGGGDTCDVALWAAKAHALSAALFAPAWVYENHPVEEFGWRQEQFWAKIGAAWQPSRPVHCGLPFATSFDLGAGRGVSLDGERVSSEPWFNLSAQDVLPALWRLRGAPLEVCYSDDVAYDGGSSLEVRCGPHSSTAVPHVRLYDVDIDVPGVGLEVSYTVATSSGADVALVLYVAAAQRRPGGPQAVPAVLMPTGGAGNSFDHKLMQVRLRDAGFRIIDTDEEAAVRLDGMLDGQPAVAHASSSSSGGSSVAMKAHEFVAWTRRRCHVASAQLPGSKVCGLGILWLTPPAPRLMARHGSGGGSSNSRGSGGGGSSGGINLSPVARVGHICITEAGSLRVPPAVQGLKCVRVLCSNSPSGSSSNSLLPDGPATAGGAATPAAPLRRLTSERVAPASMGPAASQDTSSTNNFDGLYTDLPASSLCRHLNGTLTWQVLQRSPPLAHCNIWVKFHRQQQEQHPVQRHKQLRPSGGGSSMDTLVGTGSSTPSPPTWLGKAYVDSYRLQKLLLPEDCSAVTFTVQPVTTSKVVQPLPSAATTTILTVTRLPA